MVLLRHRCHQLLALEGDEGRIGADDEEVRGIAFVRECVYVFASGGRHLEDDEVHVGIAVGEVLLIDARLERYYVDGRAHVSRVPLQRFDEILLGGEVEDADGKLLLPV